MSADFRQITKIVENTCQIMECDYAGMRRDLLNIDGGQLLWPNETSRLVRVGLLRVEIPDARQYKSIQSPLNFVLARNILSFYLRDRNRSIRRFRSLTDSGKEAAMNLVV